MPPKRSKSATGTGVTTLADIVEDPQYDTYSKIKKEFIDSMIEQGKTMKEAEIMFQARFNEAFVSQFPKSRDPLKTAIATIDRGNKSGEVRENGAQQLRKTLKEKKAHIEKTLQEQRRLQEEFDRAEKEAEPKEEGRKLGGDLTHAAVKYKRDLEGIKDMDRRKQLNESIQKIQNKMREKVADKEVEKRKAKVREQPIHGEEVTKERQKISRKEYNKKVRDLYEDKKDLEEEEKEGKYKQGLTKREKEAILRDVRDEVIEKYDVITEHKRPQKTVLDIAQQAIEKKGIKQKLTEMKQKEEEKKAILSKPVSGEAEPEPSEYKKPTKKNLKDMNAKQKETQPKINKTLNTELKTPAPPEVFKNEEEKRKKHFMFSKLKLSYRKPSDYAKKSKSMLF